MSLLISFVNTSYANEYKSLNIDGKIFSVLVKESSIYSRGCELILNCFKLPKKFHYTPNSTPSFSLCYQSGGLPFFGKISGKRITVCLNKKNKIVDLESLMKKYSQMRN